MYGRVAVTHDACMPSAAAAPTTARRLVLVPATPRRPAGSSAAPRRYRLARVAPEPREPARAERFGHLKRSYD
jgi:hypothetical protein